MKKTEKNSVRTDVLIVGAGPVGLGLAIELGSRGIACTLIELNEGVGNNPRAKLTNVRSMELMRRWGVADRLRAASPMPPGYPSDVVFTTRLNGPTLARFKNCFYTAQDGDERYAESAAWLPQYTLEHVLLERVLELPSVTVRMGTRLVTFQDDGEVVHSEIEDVDAAEKTTVRSRYVVGCDGARSTVRQTLGVRMSGLGAISPNFNVLFRAPELSKLHDKGRAVQYWMVNSDVPSLMGPMDSDGLWYIIATRMDSEVDFAKIDPRALIRRATGMEFDIELVSTDPWVAHRLIADRYSLGRVFLAGDACHMHPPFGGYGMNMGLGDAVDLGWKMAAVLQGWGGEHLLEAYEAERKPVHERVMDEAVKNYSMVSNHLVTEGMERDDALGAQTREDLGEVIKKSKLREFRSLGLVLGYTYDGSPLVVDDESQAPEEKITEYEVSAHPGCLAPHFWLNDGRSIYDMIGKGFTLLADKKLESDQFADIQKLAALKHIPFEVVRIREARLGDLYGATMALVRTDHHVVWRGNALPADVGKLLDRVCGEKVRINVEAVV